MRFAIDRRGGEVDNGFSCHKALANIVAPMLVRKCRELLEQFLVDDRQHGKCPLPRCARPSILLGCNDVMTLCLLSVRYCSVR